MPSHGAEGRTGPMQPPNRLALYEEKLVSLWERLVTTLGIHTVRVLLDRAIWQTAQRHPDLALIQHADGGLSLAALQQSYGTRTAEEIEAAFGDLAAEIALILTRLLGPEMARRSAADLAGRAAALAPPHALAWPAEMADRIPLDVGA